MKEDLLNRMMKSRLSVLFIIFILAFIYLSLRLGLITFVENQNYNQRVLYQYITKQTMSDDIVPRRGQIMDRNGIVLAENMRLYNIIFDPNGMIAQPEEVRTASMTYIANYIPGVTTLQLEQYLIDYPTLQYKKIASGYAPEAVEQLRLAIQNDEVEGVYLEGYYERHYPYDTLASDVIGIYDNAGNARYGVEEFYNEYLTGIYGRLYGYVDEGVFVQQEEVLAENGYDINITLDFTIQKHVEAALMNYMETHVAASANAVVMNPQTGEILAMASYPTFDLNEPFDLSDVIDAETLEAMTADEKLTAQYTLWKNFNLTDTFEPGSTFKALVFAAALEEGVIDMDHMFHCDGYKRVDIYDISCWNTSGHDDLTTQEALINSCNVAFMDMGELMGREMMYDYMQMFGVNQITGIDMNAEGGVSDVNTYDESELNITELATSSFGQGFNMSPLQIITAFASLVNGGYLYEPHIMSSVVDETGHIVASNEPLVIRQVISEETSDIMRESLQLVVEEGTGKRAYIEGYHIGGKTGTAEKGPRDSDKLVVSFVGYAEDEEAEVVTFVWIDEPVSDIEGVDPSSRLAVEVFVDIMDDVLPYMGVFPDAPEVEEETVIEE